MRLPGLLLLALPALASSHYFARPHPRTYFQVNAIAEGPDGLIWLANSSGLHRFDGHRYSPVAGFPWPAVEFLARARDGALWAGHSQHGLLRYEPSTGFQTKLTESVGSLAITAEGVIVAVPNDRVLVGAGGVIRRGPGLCSLRKAPLPEAAGAEWVNCAGVAAQIGMPSFRTPDMPRLFPRLAPSTAGSDQDWTRQVWLATRREIRGLSPALTLYLPARASAVAAIGEDSRGHIWVAGVARDLWEFVPQSGLEQWSAQELGATPVQVFRDGRGDLHVVTEQRILRLDAATQAWRPLARSEHSLDYVLPLPEGGVLASMSNFGLARLLSDGQVKQRIEAPAQLFPNAVIYPKLIKPHNDYRKLFRTPDGRILVGNKQALLTLADGILRRDELPDVPALTASHPVDLELDPAGRLVVGYEHGLARWDNGWHRLPANPEIAKVRSFSFRAPNEVWVAHRANGYFSRLSGSQATRFTIDQGYSPADTQFLKADSRGWIWRGTSNGIYVSNGHDVAPADWLHLPVAGESRQYGFFEDHDHTVWIAGEEGIAHFRPDPNWFAAPAATPRLQSVLIDGRTYVSLPPVLETIPRRMSISLGGIGTGLRPGAIRYRLGPVQTQWQPATNGIIELTNLTRGEFRLEMAYLGGGALPAAHVFRAGTPWYRSLRSAWLLLPAGLIAWLWHRWSGMYWVRKAWFVTRRRWGSRSAEADDGEIRDLQGRTLRDRYELTTLVSTSALSTVYRARHLPSEQSDVVVKILHQAAGEHQWVRSRFAQEVAALHSIRHPGVVPVLDSWILPEGNPCLVMPWLNGPTLREALIQGPWPKSRVAAFARRVGEALQVIHNAGVVHRDLKPENIVILAADEPVVIDFGNAGLLGAQEEMGSTRVLAGSLRYLAPERLTGHYSPASDTFALAAILVELLTGSTLDQFSTSITASGFVQALKAVLAEAGAESAAEALAAGLRIDPSARPAHVGGWSAEIANSLGFAAGASST